jgi:hypothetical protein
MGTALRYVQQLIRLGHFNHPCSTKADIEMAERAITDACITDFEAAIERLRTDPGVSASELARLRDGILRLAEPGGPGEVKSPC